MIDPLIDPLNGDPRLRGRLLHLDDELIVIDKPAGISSTGLSLDDEDCAQGRLMRCFGGMVWAAHQLDKPTSGVNVFTRSARGVERVRRAMTAPGSAKEYLAIVHGEPPFDALCVDAPIGFVDAGQHNLGIAPGKAARTTVEVIDRRGGFGLLRACLHTGRTHQVRIHLALLGHPLVGENWYRDPPCTLAPRHALHAVRLVLGGHASHRFETPLPDDLRVLAIGLGLDPTPTPPA